MVKYKTIKQFAAESGYTERAIRSKCQDGTWIEGQVWMRAPDRRVLISIEGFNAWVESGPAPREALRVMTRRPSKDKVLSPPPLA